MKVWVHNFVKNSNSQIVPLEHDFHCSNSMELIHNLPIIKIKFFFFAHFSEYESKVHHSCKKKNLKWFLKYLNYRKPSYIDALLSTHKSRQVLFWTFDALEVNTPNTLLQMRFKKYWSVYFINFNFVQRNVHNTFSNTLFPSTLL